MTIGGVDSLDSKIKSATGYAMSYQDYLNIINN
jgi:hypothetical protein